MDTQPNPSPAGFLLLILGILTFVFLLINAPQWIPLAKPTPIPVTGATRTPAAPTPTAEMGWLAQQTWTALEAQTRLVQAQAALLEQQRALEQVKIQATAQAAQATRQAWQATAEVSQTSVALVQGMAAAKATQVVGEQAEGEITRQAQTMQAVFVLCIGISTVIVILALTWAARTLWESRRREAEAAARKLEQLCLLEESRRREKALALAPQRKNGHFPGKIPAQAGASAEKLPRSLAG